MPAEIIGFCRFSFFGPSDTKLSYVDPAVAHKKLYAPERMAARFTLFEELFLPSLAVQSDPDYRLIVLSSTCMPERYQQRLHAACARVPQIELVISDNDVLADVIRPYTQHPDLAKSGLLQFRCDDDDALGRDFIARLRHWAPMMDDHMLLTQPRGLMLYDVDGTRRLHPMYRNLTGAGFAYRSHGPTKKNVFGFAHINAGRRLPYLSDPSRGAFIQTFTASSDTAFRAPRKIKRFLEASGVEAESPQSAKLVTTLLERDFPAFEEESLKDIFRRANQQALGQDTSHNTQPAQFIRAQSNT